ncbi:uncharacterized protein LOC119547189 [Drosophila subpulchrella]|uniref:uncharacterized protein LOC119547189 n=1 Tax=Drosophila subpulchrella TaxID=1486046 RepID=UPI0018A17FD4|nr:uncharacterized protein LOC119547189 [Drosophila subpulchrella]
MFLQVFLNNANLSRKTVFVNVKQNFNVSDLKLELFKSVKIPVPRQVIEFSGTILTDDFLVANAHNKNGVDLFAYDGQKLVCRLRFRDKKELKESLLISMMSRNNEKPLDAQSELVGSADGSSSASSPTSSICSSAKSTRIPVFACVRPFVNEQSCGDSCQVNCCDEGGVGRPSYARIMPEDRWYGVVITNEGDPCDCNFDCVLQHLVESFHSAVDVATLSFSQCTPAVSFECFLLMECRDSDTSDWLQRAMRPMNPPYLCSTFIEHFELVRCSFVVPMVVERELCRIFHIMEKQNCGLDSSKWCVVRKTALDSCSEDYAKKVVFDGFPNYELVVYMDNCSKVYIEKQCGKLLFLMWHLSVDFD